MRSNLPVEQADQVLFAPYVERLKDLYEIGYGYTN